MDDGRRRRCGLRKDKVPMVAGAGTGGRDGRYLEVEEMGIEVERGGGVKSERAGRREDYGRRRGVGDVAVVVWWGRGEGLGWGQGM